MSTRSIVRIVDKNYNVDLYHHYDGYPEGVGRQLMAIAYPIIQRFNCYGWKDLYRMLKEHDDDYRIAEGIHPDIEYLYIINLKTKQIECFDGHYRVDGEHDYKWETYKVVDLKQFLPIKQKVKYR